MAHPIRCTDVDGHHAYQLLVAAYYWARIDEDQQRADDIRAAIELCLPEDRAIQRAATRQLRAGR